MSCIDALRNTGIRLDMSHFIKRKKEGTACSLSSLLLSALQQPYFVTEQVRDDFSGLVAAFYNACEDWDISGLMS